MEINVSGKHIEITEPIHAYALGKAEKLPHFFDRITGIQILIDKAKHHQFEVEVIAAVEHHDPFVAKANGNDLYACIDDATDKTQRQLRDHKDKLRNRKHNV